VRTQIRVPGHGHGGQPSQRAAAPTEVGPPADSVGDMPSGTPGEGAVP
jgi:hypothetical protein